MVLDTIVSQPYVLFFFFFNRGDTEGTNYSKIFCLLFVYVFLCKFVSGLILWFMDPPKGGRGCLMSPPCLESLGCHLIPLCYLLSCSSA